MTSGFGESLMMTTKWKVNTFGLVIALGCLLFVWISYGGRSVLVMLTGGLLYAAIRDCLTIYYGSFVGNPLCIFRNDRVVVETISDIEWERHQATSCGKYWQASWIVCCGTCTLVKVVFVRLAYRLSDTVRKLVG